MVRLPWAAGERPLMLAPMQGLTNGALRACSMEHGRPDVVWTEFVRVQGGSRKPVRRSDLEEIRSHVGPAPLVVQLIGGSADALADAARVAEDAGAEHLNLNLGCPYGRMTTCATGGGLLKDPLALAALLSTLRPAVRGSFSIKCRTGWDDPRQVFALLPIFEDVGVDFVVLHARTVEQKFKGEADHALGARVVAATSLPVLLNGDIRDAARGRLLLAESGAAGLMIGRGALADPLLFRRLRGELPDAPTESERRAELRVFVADLLERYQRLFHGERQVLAKIKDVIGFMGEGDLEPDVKRLRRAKTIERFLDELELMSPRDPERSAA